jgi:chemotaxis protein CheZ
MPVRQKTFRIEQMTKRGAARGITGAPPGAAGAALQHQEVLTELKALRELIERRAPPIANEPEGAIGNDQITVGDLNQLKTETDSIHRAINRTIQELASLHFGAFGNAGHGRASRELDAVVESSERATQQILEAAEGIDEAANTLSASLKHEQEQELASDIRDHVVRIFEASNFQDLSGQRIAKVIATLAFVEDRVARMLEIWGGRDAVQEHVTVPTERSIEAVLAGGPKLSGDCGHISQQEIDAMFA